MKFTKVEEVHYDVKWVLMTLPDPHEELDPEMPMLSEGALKILVNIETGEIIGWPKGQDHSYEVYLKVVDMGRYHLYTEDMTLVSSIEKDYVPDSVIPGDYGDYVELNINDQGFITNWKKPTTFEGFK